MNKNSYLKFNKKTKLWEFWGFYKFLCFKFHFKRKMRKNKIEKIKSKRQFYEMR